MSLTIIDELLKTALVLLTCMDSFWQLKPM